MEKESFSAWDVHHALSRLCTVNKRANKHLCSYLSKQLWSQDDRQKILDSLSGLIQNGDCVVDICCCFESLILEIVARCVRTIVKDGNFDLRILQKFAISISEGLPLSAEIQRFAVDFMRTYKPLISINSEDVQDCEPVRKKIKRTKISDLDWCRSLWMYLSYLPSVSDLLDISSLPDYLSNSDTTVRWYAASALCLHLEMSENESMEFLRKYFSVEEQRQLKIRMVSEMYELHQKKQSALDSSSTVLIEKSQTHTKHKVLSLDLSCDVVCIEGILLPRVQEQVYNEKSFHPLVVVPSTQQNLRCLALAVSVGQPVLLQGPVGCGKTSLVEHLARSTGRCGDSQLLKIQLGDQTDSKALLGTYCSTEVPGEFVWRAGVLTQAILKGKWVLLEDIDTAPMDILSLLIALAETGSLSVPGHGDEVRAAPGFQLFTTQRLVSSSGGLHQQHGTRTSLLEKLCRVVNVEPLSRDELKEVISVRFPALVPVMDRLLDIYFTFSHGKHDLGDVDSTTDVLKTPAVLSVGGRLISTRDLMTWCDRSNENFDANSSSQGLKVFQEALDCFVVCLTKCSARLSLATTIAAKLNLSEERARYYSVEYKPSLRESTGALEVGRCKLQRKKKSTASFKRSNTPVFSYTRSAIVLLERVAVCVSRNEPVLLVGETGTGKTSTVQFLSHYMGHRLHVINLNQQSDSTDLIGGFKPVDFKTIIMPLREEFEILFCESFSRAQNEKFLSHIQTLFSKKRWNDLLLLMQAPLKNAFQKYKPDTNEYQLWTKVTRRIHELKLQLKEAENVLAFSFIEGTLVRALRNGDWVLLDEINLAAAETLDCLSGLLESTTGSLVLTERGDTEPIKRHPDFRLFACMNPATDVGKKDLPLGIRNRFTEFYVEELECPKDLSTLVRDYLPGLSLSSKQISGMVTFYLTIKSDQSDKLKDGTGHRPHFSLRSLCRALRYCAKNPCRSIPGSLFEGFCLSFLTQLDRSSHPVVEKMICKHVLGNVAIKAVLGQKIPKPEGPGDYVPVADHWISKGRLDPSVPPHYIVTPSVKLNLKDLCRVVSAGKHPVLLQGETSVGKTSLITYLAQLTGNVCVRVNNHEHTDLQEYIGCYAADKQGKLAFRHGVLVEAMRKGHWIILDELNLAPSDVLEALNRLLDDNQELFIPETQEVIQAHPKFMLFATQNPPGLYGGRKILSRAFRNRFIELHFDEIPPPELETILHERCSIPLSYARKLVAVMLELQTRRSGSSIFFGKQGFMTLRDLFRWAQRYNCPEAGKGKKFYDWDQHLADHGYMLLAGRVRKQEEEAVIAEIIAKHLKRQVSSGSLFSITPDTSAPLSKLLQSVMTQSLPGFQHIVWTQSMRRLAVLIGQAIRFKEPILLVGDTGVGKTTICQLYAAMRSIGLHIINCHMHTESADFLGGLRPVRVHDQDDEEQGADQKLFEWKDGPLVIAMKEGSMFLIDEISLADDSVLERLNSVLEPERTLLLAERGGIEDGNQETDVEKIQAADNFHVFATMNPGGDFGKKELSPALRNRFTEIWCPQSMDRDDLISIIEKNIQSGLHLCNTEDGTSGFGHAMMDFIQWFAGTDFGKRSTISIRDILSWVYFINATYSRCLSTIADSNQQASSAYLHGACLVFIDSLGAGSSSFSGQVNTQSIRHTCLAFLVKQLNTMTGQAVDLIEAGIHVSGTENLEVILTDDKLTISPFSVDRDPKQDTSHEQFALRAPTTCINAQRVLRGLQLHRPILLEGSPGVGKTSLVAAVARIARKKLVRINLSEQTDVTDLFGADLPVEGEEGGRFAWRDGPFLQALKAGHWVVFDELNLASQSVLEGLNACFDHRGEVFVPELGKTFHIEHGSTRIFACQNPLVQGGGRKGLPKSFLNRFTQVYVDSLTERDLNFILVSMYPEFPTSMLQDMVTFNKQIYQETMLERFWGVKGSPWEFNLRDLIRWCELMKANQSVYTFNPGEFVGLLYRDRMRTAGDKLKVEEIYQSTLGSSYPLYSSSRYFHLGLSSVQVGFSFLPRQGSSTGDQRLALSGKSYLPLHHCQEPLESLMKCVEMGWLAILLGPQSSGKTSLVRLLAQLTGHPLCVLSMNSSMDTTEMLGGFEQTDIWRHISEVAHLMEAELRHLEKNILVGGIMSDKSIVTALESSWSLYHQIPTSAEGLASEEMISKLNEHLKQLECLARQLQNISCHSQDKNKANMGEIQNRLSQISLAVSRMKPGAGGGAFEWVDSILVKALTNGHWLLVDNVNFCSASVLDRLNALLEPGGVLSINERGTVDGNIVSLKPHPDFRLFFAMDPNRGEISRAMRNRGIEIYMLGEAEGYLYSKEDQSSLLAAIGVADIASQKCLMSLNDRLCSELPSAERPVLADLLQAGSICCQLRARTFEPRTSLRHAIIDVYVSTRKNRGLKQLVRSLAEEELNAWDASQDPNPLRVLPSVVRPSVTESSLMYKVKDSFSLLLQLLGEIHAMGSLTTRRAQVQLQSAAAIFSSQQSEPCWLLALEWLDFILPSVTKVLVDSSQGEALVTESIQLSIANVKTLIADNMNLVFQHCSWKKIGTMLKALFADRHDASACLQDQPWDLTFNPQSIRKAIVEKTMDDQSQEQLVQIHKLIQRLQISQQCNTVVAYLKQKVEALEGSLTQGKKKNPATTVQNLLTLFLSQIHLHLTDVVHDLKDADFDLLYQNPATLLWLTRLADMTFTFKSQRRETFTAQVALHWQWVAAKLNFLFSSTVTSENPKLSMAVSELNRRFGSNDLAVKQFTRFLSAFGHPRSFTSCQEAEVVVRMAGIVSALTPKPSDHWRVTKKRTDLLAGSGVAVRRLVYEVFQHVWKGDIGHANAASLALATFLQDASVMAKPTPARPSGRQRARNANEDVEMKAVVEEDEPLAVDLTTSNTSPSQFVPMWPVFDHVTLLVKSSLMAEGFCLDGSGSLVLRSKDDEQLGLREFSWSHSPWVNDDYIDCHCDEAQNVKANLVSRWHELLTHIWHSTSTNSPSQWLQWNDQVDEENSRIDKVVDPSILHKSPLSQFVMEILSAGSNPASPELLPLHISLGGLTEQTRVVALVSRHVWCHSGTLTNQEFDQRLMQKKLLLHSFLHLLHSMQFTFTPEEQKVWAEGVDRFSTESTPHQSLSHLLTLVGSKSQPLQPAVAALLSRCFEVMVNVCQETLTEKLPPITGHGLVYVGLLLAHFLCPCGPVDPVQKAGIKLEHIITEMDDIESELSVWDRHYFMKTGKNIIQTSQNHLHPRVIYLISRREHLQGCRAKLEKKCAYRPNHAQFTQLCQTMSTFLDNAFSITRITDLVGKLNFVLMQPSSSLDNDVSTSMALQEEQIWQGTVERFVCQLQSSFQCYQDFVVPFCMALYQVKTGMRLMADYVDKTVRLHKCPALGPISQVVKSLCQYPSVSYVTPDFLGLANQMASTMTHDLVQAVIMSHNKDQDNEKIKLEGMKSKLLVSALLLLNAHSVSTQRLDSRLVLALSRVLDLFTRAWVDYEDRKRQKELEESALYKYKSETHGDERSEKEKEEEEFLSAYPSFNKDFMDVTGADRLEDTGLEATDNEGANVASSVSMERVAQKEMATVCQVHGSILTLLTSSDWLEKRQPCKVEKNALTEPWLMVYGIGSQVVKNARDVLGPDLDKTILGSHLLVSGSVLHKLNVFGSSWQSQALPDQPEGKMYNFYHDANVQEVIKCRPVIDSLSKRVAELQKEWPEHPTLKLINQIRDRILSFSMTSPVLKFLTGLELLLEKAQDWESNAASFVSVATQLTEITGIIVQWRKLELSCWSSSLDREEEKCKEKASAWWFYLYRLVSDHLDQGQSDKRIAPGESPNGGIETALKTFMEGSTMGEYQVRLDMLMAFHCQLVNMESSAWQKQLLHLLWNVYQFYHQFLPAIQSEIKRLRNPIEKQLKGYVKIARWSDLNYWALKMTTEKTHRTVHKYVREYQGVLNQPVKSLLGEKVENAVAAALQELPKLSLEEKLNRFTQHLFNTIGKADTVPCHTVGAIDEGSILSRLPHLLRRMTSHVRKSWKKLNHSSSIQVFDDFTGELIQDIHELQGLQVDMSAEKAKQKSQAKAFDLRKRKGLSELFRMLTFIGLSYRKGMASKHKPGFGSAMQQSCVNLSFGLSLPLTELWNGCQDYFFRCISRHAQFMGAFIQPSKELTVADIDRCYGFIEHFSQVYLEQRRNLSQLATHYKALRRKVQTLMALGALTSYQLPSQTEAFSWLEKMKGLTTQLSQGIGQFLLLLETCPGNPSDVGTDRVHPSPLSSDQLSPSALWTRGDPDWNQSMDEVKKLKNEVEKGQTTIDKLFNNSIIGRPDIEIMHNTVQQFQTFIPVMSRLADLFREATSERSSCFVDCFDFLGCQIKSIAESFSAWRNESFTNFPTQMYDGKYDSSVSDVHNGGMSLGFKKDVETLVESVLLGVQSIVKLSIPNEEEEIKQSSDPDTEEFSELKESHLSLHLLGKMSSMDACLGHEKIKNHLEQLLTSLHGLSDQFGVDTRECVQCLISATPVVSTYATLMESHLGHSVAIHRSMGKLLSVLLAVFTELFQKGFCIPPELSEEMEGEGSTEFKDIEGGGIGEGEGAKDVSDQIESEDQLEEAKKPGEEDKPDDSKDQPDIPEEDAGIEMSDDFDGKLHNMDEQEGKEDDNDDDKDKEGEEDMDKQMGEADGEQSEKLDERMWGSDEEEEEEEDGKEMGEEDGGGGMDKQKEEMVAKDDNKNAADAGDEEDEEPQTRKEEDKQENQGMESDEEYDDNQVNPHNQDTEENPDNLDLPDDLNLDDGEAKGEEEKEEQDMETDVDKDEEEGKTDEDKKDEEVDAETQEDIQQEENSKEDDNELNKQGQDGEEKDGKEAEKEEDGNADGLKAELPTDEEEEEKKEEEKEGEGKEGESAQEEEKPTSEIKRNKTEEKPSEDKPDNSGDKEGNRNDNVDVADSTVEGMEQEDSARQEDEHQERDAMGMSTAEDQDGHEVSDSKQTMDGAGGREKKTQRNPGQSDDKRTLGSQDKEHRRLKTKDTSTPVEEGDNEDKERENHESMEYEHVKDATSSYDAQTVDVATKEQMSEKQAVPNEEEEEGDEVDEDDDVKMEDENDEEKDEDRIPEKQATKAKRQREKEDKDKQKESEEPGQESRQVEVEGEKVLTMTVARGPESTIHTVMENLHLGLAPEEVDLESLRSQLEETVRVWSHPEGDASDAMAASEAWQKYLTITEPLSQELCEQLRLILEPSQATKLKGDYRTGKRLNMRKVIPYIASQFRKDKIWLRRSKPSKRQYQIMVAVDDSASMADNHTKQLAFESLALVSNALTLLESGELAICSFGEEIRLLHSFNEPFTNQSGATILQQLSCEQKQTKYGLLLEKALALMQDAKSRHPASTSLHRDTAQLLLILSDGHGIFREGMETVRRAVERARASAIFLVFVVMDNPEQKSSILESRVPIMDSTGKIQEIKSYLELFPFPFYVILRDINQMPQVLSDALRQWFELVTASDR